jgi:hypothetical protein
MVAEIMVYNPIGVLVISKTDVDLRGYFQLDISPLKAGIYFIRITGENARQTIKLVVQ